MTADPVLELRSVSVGFRSRRGLVRAVDGIDLEVAPGEVVAVVGESGCGKTTLVRTTIGLDPTAQRAGEILLDGHPIERSAAGLGRLRRAVQLVMQDPTGALNPRRSVYDVVAEGIRIHRLAGREPGRDEESLVLAALADAGLRPPERFVDRYPHELSGGQRQRVVIAAALAIGPRVLLADEPVASLDASIRGEILALLRTLVDERGLAVVAVTHDLGLAWNIADRIVVMYLGRVVESGPVEAVLAAPAHPYTQALLSVVPEVAHLAPQVLEGEPPDPASVPPGCRFHLRCPLVASGEAERLGIADRCRGEDLGLRPVTTSAPSHRVACHAVEAPRVSPGAATH